MYSMNHTIHKDKDLNWIFVQICACTILLLSLTIHRYKDLNRIFVQICACTIIFLSLSLSKRALNETINNIYFVVLGSRNLNANKKVKKKYG